MSSVAQMNMWAAGWFSGLKLKEFDFHSYFIGQIVLVKFVGEPHSSPKFSFISPISGKKVHS